LNEEGPMTTMNPSDFQPPLVAILRGLEAPRAAEVGRVLFDAGFRLLEVPLNRPGALDCIATLSELKLPGVLVGGGTMLSVADVDAVHAAGGRLFVSPNCNPQVIAHAVGLGMLAAPGVATPTEAFAALDAGAHALKLFPFETIGLGGLKAMLSVLPVGTPLWPVGGVTPQSIAPGVQAGATGFGIGSQLFRPGVSLTALADAARAFVAAWSAAGH
jgi:2-dehydro-3-deoxyphosphogalactonate aldolase